MHIWLLAALTILGLGATPDLIHAQSGPFSVTDAIKMLHFSEPKERSLTPPAWNISPDGSLAIIVTTRGVIASNAVESTLWTVDLRAVARYLDGPGERPQPVPKSIFSVKGQLRTPQDNSYGSLITNARWCLDSKTISMLVERRGGRRELDRVNVTTGRKERLSAEGYSVDSYEVDGRNVLYSADQLQRGAEPSGSRASDVVDSVRGSSLNDLLWPAVHPKKFLFRSDDRGLVPIAPAPWWNPSSKFFFLSPDGNTVVTLVPVDETPITWKPYLPSVLSGPLYWPASSRSPVLEYEVVDLRTMSRRPLLGSPSGLSSGYDDVPNVVWSSTSRHALVTNTFLPFGHLTQKEQELRRRLCAAAYVDMDDGSAACIVFARSSILKESEESWAISDIRFGLTDHEVVVHLQWRGRQKMECYSSTGSVWSQETNSACEVSSEGLGERDRAPVRLELSQSLDKPPTLWAADVKNSRRIEIWNPNPQIAGKVSGTTSVFHWQDKSKREWTGALMLPDGFKPGGRYPLVIQTHGFIADKFLVDGVWTTAMAARPLAAAGFVVLQVEDKYERKSTLEEAKIHVDGYQAAIDRLAGDRVIDPKRVGIIGFSRTCWYVEESLLEFPDSFAAAAMADGVDQSYFQYMMLAPENPAMESEQENGGRPIGKGLEAWITAAPGFRLSELNTPLRLQAIGPLSLLAEWEIYASLKVQNKPVDMLYLPLGQHVLQNPAERMASEQGDVDWLRFWLKDEEDHDPAKRTQYERWERLRNERAK